MSEHNRNWWAGVADITASGLNHGALKVERIHLSIADETFNILQRVPITRPWSEAVRSIHHGISVSPIAAFRWRLPVLKHP